MDLQTGRSRVFYFDPEGNCIDISKPIETHLHAVSLCKQYVNDNKDYNASVMKLMHTTQEPKKLKWEGTPKQMDKLT